MDNGSEKIKKDPIFFIKTGSFFIVTNPIQPEAVQRLSPVRFFETQHGVICSEINLLGLVPNVRCKPNRIMDN
jgi:hypothetical protein